MTTPNTPFLLARKSQEALVQFYRVSVQSCRGAWNMREQMAEVDRLYQREKDWTVSNTRAIVANRRGDADKVRNIQMPIVMPQVESAVLYQASVFLTGVPLFGVVSDPANVDAALQLEAVLDSQSVEGGWSREFLLALREGFKYNLMCVEVDWCRKMVASLETDFTFTAGKQARPKESIWEGNSVRYRPLYNSFFDTRCIPTEIHTKGEFAGYTELVSRIELKQRIAELPDRMVDNIVPAFNSSTGAISTVSSSASDGAIWNYFVPNINPDALVDRNLWTGQNWLAWASLTGADSGRIQYKDCYELTTLYAKILPNDFGINVPASKTPQIWKFIIVNHEHLIYAQRQTNAHGFLPMIFGQPLEDGLGYQTKSLAVNVAPVQSITSSLLNSVLAARRRAISDRGLFDPSRVTEANINADNPSAKIPVRPAAYGKPLSDAYFAIPFRDDNSGQILQEVGLFNNFANLISGQNPARQGQFVKGNKTLREYESVMQNANGRDQMTSILLEAQFFTPVKTILKTNVLQYQGAGSVYSRSNQQVISVDPLALRKAVMAMRVSDGLIPSEKIVGGDVLQVALQVLGSSPAIGAGYNIAPLFSYLMKSQGADLKAFEKSPQQVAYEQAMQQWQQVCLEAVKAGAQSGQLPPQPLPQQYGYDPTKQGGPSGPAPAAPKINNITNNISDNRQDEAYS